MGFLLGTLYMPNAPWYILGAVRESEIGIWSQGMLIISFIFLVLCFYSKPLWSKIIRIFLLIVLGILNFGSLFWYAIFLPQGSIPTMFGEANVSVPKALLHVIFVGLVIINLYTLYKVELTNRQTEKKVH